MKHLEYKECPKPSCYQTFKTRRESFEHYRDKHYHLERPHHSEFENLCYAILQELVVFEANKTGRNPLKTEKRALAIHALMKHLGLSLQWVSCILNSSSPIIGALAYSGYGYCIHCHPSEGVHGSRGDGE